MARPRERTDKAIQPRRSRQIEAVDTPSIFQNNSAKIFNEIESYRQLDHRASEDQLDPVAPAPQSVRTADGRNSAGQVTMQSKGKKKEIPVDSGAIPASEEHVYLYSKSGAERIAELEGKRRAYESLDAELETLPRKLEHRGLVPLGPGLYAQGSLVRTNEVLVLLGESYFAERSAYQAREIVQRRLQVIESKIAEVDVGKNEVEDALGNHDVQGQKPDAQAEVPLPAFQDPMKSGKNSASNHEQGAAAGSGTRKDVSGRRPPRSPQSSDAKVSNGLAGTPRANASKAKRVSFSESTKKESVESSTVEKSRKKTPSDTIRELLSNFSNSVEQAKQICKEGDVVNLMEEYDANGKLKAVNAPENSGPESAIVTADDEYEDLLDMSRPKKPDAELGRKDYLKMLIEVEREEELEQQRKEAKRAERVQKKEMNEFGNGFAKGFFDKKGKRDEKTNKEPKSILRNSSDCPLVDADAPADTGNTAVQQEVEVDEVPLGRQVLKNNIVERGSGTRRRRRRAAPQKKSRTPMLNVQEVEEATKAADSGVAVTEEEPSQVPKMSKFKQMRAMQQK